MNEVSGLGPELRRTHAIRCSLRVEIESAVLRARKGSAREVE